MSKINILYTAVFVVIVGALIASAKYGGKPLPNKLCNDPTFQEAMLIEYKHDSERIKYLEANFDKLPRSVISAEADTIIKYAQHRLDIYDSLHCRNYVLVRK